MDYKQIYDYIVKIQSIAKIGLVFSKDPYALTNYQQINDISLKMLEEFMEVKFDRPNYFKRDVYPTPNVSVRTVIFNSDNLTINIVSRLVYSSFRNATLEHFTSLGISFSKIQTQEHLL